MLMMWKRPDFESICVDTFETNLNLQQSRHNMLMVSNPIIAQFVFCLIGGGVLITR